MNRIPTGIDQLDELLHGGFPAGSSVLIAGLPGSGKTILAHQMMFHNAAPDFRVVYLTTLAEPQIKVLKFQQEFSFFDRAKVQKSLIYRDLGYILKKQGPDEALSAIDGLLKAHEPKLVILDSIKTISDMMPGVVEFRQFMLDLSLRLNTWGCTAVFLAEYGGDEIELRPESALVDGIVFLSGMEEKKRQRRFLRINKMRGTPYGGGENAFKITGDGITLYPRLKPDLASRAYAESRKTRISWGLPGMDVLTDGGIPRGSTTLITGGAGTGKTVMALHFVHAGLAAGESALYVSFEEHPAQLMATADSFGLDLAGPAAAGRLEMMHVSPMELDVDEHGAQIQAVAQALDASRVVIDSVSAFELSMADKAKYTDYIWALSDYFRSWGRSLLMTHEMSEHNVMEFTKHGMSYVADNLVLLRFIETGSELRRGLRIVKMRSSRHNMEIRELRIEGNRLIVAEAPALAWQAHN